VYAFRLPISKKGPEGGLAHKTGQDRGKSRAILPSPTDPHNKDCEDLGALDGLMNKPEQPHRVDPEGN
jgi:hypothetical protein